MESVLFYVFVYFYCSVRTLADSLINHELVWRAFPLNETLPDRLLAISDAASVDHGRKFRQAANKFAPAVPEKQLTPK